MILFFYLAFQSHMFSKMAEALRTNKTMYLTNFLATQVRNYKQKNRESISNAVIAKYLLIQAIYFFMYQTSESVKLDMHSDKFSIKQYMHLHICMHSRFPLPMSFVFHSI